MAPVLIMHWSHFFCQKVDVDDLVDIFERHDRMDENREGEVLCGGTYVGMGRVKAIREADRRDADHETKVTAFLKMLRAKKG